MRFKETEQMNVDKTSLSTSAWQMADAGAGCGLVPRAVCRRFPAFRTIPCRRPAMDANRPEASLSDSGYNNYVGSSQGRESTLA